MLTILMSLLATGTMSQCLKADIVFILDWSGSEDSNRVYIPSAAMAFVGGLDLGPSSVKIGLIPFNEDPMLSHCLYPSDDAFMVNEVLISLMGTRPVGGTRFTSSFELADSYFEHSESERGEQVIRIIIFISDGDENEVFDRELSVGTAAVLKAKGALIWCIVTPPRNGAYNSREQGHMKRICSQPVEAFYIEKEYYGLKEELKRLNICP